MRPCEINHNLTCEECDFYNEKGRSNEDKCTFYDEEAGLDE